MSDAQSTKNQLAAARKTARRKPEALAASLKREYGLTQAGDNIVAREILSNARNVAMNLPVLRRLSREPIDN